MLRGCTGVGRIHGMHAGAFGARFRIPATGRSIAVSRCPRYVRSSPENTTACFSRFLRWAMTCGWRSTSICPARQSGLRAIFAHARHDALFHRQRLYRCRSPRCHTDDEAALSLPHARVAVNAKASISPINVPIEQTRQNCRSGRAPTIRTAMLLFGKSKTVLSYLCAARNCARFSIRRARAIGIASPSFRPRFGDDIFPFRKFLNSCAS